MQNQNVYVAPGLSLQLQRARDIVADKIKYLKLEGKKERDWKYHNREDKMILLQEVHDLFHDSYLEARRVSFLPAQRKKYDTLERMVMSVTEQTQAKVDLDEIYDDRAKPKVVEDTHADEQAVAVDVDVSDSMFSWLYSTGVKEKVIGSVVTLFTIVGSVGIYYLVKVF